METKGVVGLKAMVVYGVILVFILSSAVSATSISASPAEITFRDMLRGGYAEKTITVGTIEAEPLSIDITATGEIKDWLTFEPVKFVLTKEDKGKVLVKVNIPSNIPNGAYSGSITVRAAPEAKTGEGSGMSIAAAVAIITSVEVTGVEKKAFRLAGASTGDVEEGDSIPFTVDIINDGNVKVTPLIRINILDSAGSIVKTEEYKKTELAPTKREALLIKVSSTGLPVGKYSADVAALQDGAEVGRQTLSFEILERGTLAAKGVLKQIMLNKIWVLPGEMVKIDAVFENIGQKALTVKFQGEVYLVDETYKTESLIKTFETDTLDVGVWETAALSSYYTPEKAGTYIIRGAVAYSGRKTRTQETVLNVLIKPKDYRPYIALIIIVIILAAVFVWKKLEKKKDKLVEGFGKDWSKVIGEGEK